ncbi:RagB/SusD family nutrient uptake outer membrane protein [Bacteroides congonensis]|uniref:RagB/SusD family nutrient uptake outer membrane protein n=1 Tax=Bacteroides congonensis TaxID=1871006 RepID=UPI000934F4C8|nr:RagB/SusD family nutrient uptake outer membrane protein [Bacteroides congonensis]
MKIKIVYTMALVMLLGMSSCQNTFLDLEPLDTRTDAVYFKRASDFNEYALSFYGQLQGWGSRYGSIYNYMDVSSDLSTYMQYSQDLARGTVQIPYSDERWDKCYENIRTVNILLEKANDYPGKREEIGRYISEAYFFRAYTYFYLLKFFGGVPVVTTVMDVDSPELTGPRNSRYEVVDLILSDLNRAIDGLPVEQSIPVTEKGRISYYGAKAFKARVLLYEATWRKYNGTSTDYEGSAGPASEQVNDFLDEAISLCDDVMANGKYSIWNYNSVSAMKNMSSRYLFCLEDADSNPAGLGKSSNNEFIIYGVYDKSLRPGATNINQTVSKMDASRKLVDMFLCTDGLPVALSSKFKGYATPSAEFKNRDYRLKSYIGEPDDNKTLTDGRSGYSNAKFYHAHTAKDKEESSNYPVLRLAEVFLTYAEALYERNGEVTDVQLNRSINILRGRAGVANLTNQFITEHELDMLTEIRRERTVELYMEGYRFDDLKRWGIAERELNVAHCGMVVGDALYPTTFKDKNGNPTSLYSIYKYPYGETSVLTGVGLSKCVVIESQENLNFSKTHYLWPVPQQQINMNPNLKQNPGY